MRYLLSLTLLAFAACYSEPLEPVESIKTVEPSHQEPEAWEAFAEITENGLEEQGAFEPLVKLEIVGIVRSGKSMFEGLPSMTYSDQASYTTQTDLRVGVHSIRRTNRKISDSMVTVTEDTIKNSAGRDLLTLGVDWLDQPEVIVRKLNALDEGSSEPRLVLYKVYVTPQYRGTDIANRRVILSYYRDGQLHGADVVWPMLKSGVHLGHQVSRESAIQKVAKRVAEHENLAQTSNPLHYSSVYLVQDGQLVHTVTVEAATRSHMGPDRGPIVGIEVPL